MGEIRLSCLQAGEQGIITSVELDLEQKQRLSELGFIPGGKVSVLYAAPSGSPVAYYIKGAVVALRTCDSREIWVYSDEIC